MNYFRRKRRPFVSLPRHRRSDLVISLKGEIRRDAAIYGGKFTSHLILDEPGRPDIYNQWFDFCFPGSDRFILWNATIITARKAFWEKAYDLSFERTVAALSEEEREEEFKLEFIPAKRSSTGKILSYKLVQHEKKCFAQFDGLTFDEQRKKLEAEIIRNEPPPIYESFRIDRSYVYGIGLHIVLDMDVINRNAIATTIEHFFAVGETDWVSPEPVPRERLPWQSENEALAAVDYPSVLMGKSVRE